jgi:NADH dehydrogenase [ubiquinone] 1 alpha subcomplex assembly factor 6
VVEPASFLAADLRKSDPDRYLLTLFAPRAVRPALWALFAFNAELVKTRSAVSNTQLGLIRLQWWRDEIARIYGGGDGGQIPVLSTLAPLIHKGGLPHEWFEALLYAREFDLEDVAPANWAGLTNYADFTTTPLNQLALKIVGETASLEEIQQISINYGLMEAIRGVPLLLSQRRCLLPEDELMARDLSPQKIMDFNHKADILEILQLKQSLFSAYRKPESRFLKRQQRMTFIYLDRLTKNNFDVFLSEMQFPPPFLALRVALVG